MSEIEKILRKRPTYVGFLTAGDGGYEHSRKAILALIAGGVDIIEIGVPFSDPVADGPSIQQASERAIKQGSSMEQVLELIRQVRQQTTTPIILFSYYNPILACQQDFYGRLKAAGANGILVVDLPLAEAGHHLEQCKLHKIDPIFLISPSTSMQRIESFKPYAKGMLYYVCRNGTTGVKSSLPDDFASKLETIKQHINLPVVAGFGIANREMAAQALQHADGFVVGSRFVDAAHKTQNYQELTQLARDIKPLL